MIKDHLVFEAPIATAAHLDLEIPAVNVGQTGFFRFRIPAQAIQRTQSRVAAAPEKAVPKAKSGFPSIAGVWQEGPEENQIQVVVTQNADKFTATCTYQHKQYGEIRWRDDRYHIKGGGNQRDSRTYQSTTRLAASKSHRKVLGN